MNDHLMRRRAERDTGADPSLPKLAQVSDIDQFWAVDASWAASAIDKLGAISIGECAERQAEFEAASGEDGDKKPPYEMAGSTAIIGIAGPMTKRPTSAAWLFGGASTVETRRALTAAERDPKVSSVLLLVDSPGGQVAGVAELGDTVKSLSKPVSAYIEDTGCSAAYWVASQADKVYANRSAMVGSIGVRTVIYDTSSRAAMAGVKVLPIASGSLKAAGEPGAPVSAKDAAYFQALIDGHFANFRAAVKAGRSMSDEQFAKVSDGRSMLAQEAAELGLIDGVCSLEECLSQLSGAASSAGSTSAASAVHDQAIANSAAKETPMNLKEIIGRLRGADPQALEQLAGIKPDDLQAMDATGAATSVDERIAKLENAALLASAESFFEGLLTPDADGRAYAIEAQREGTVQTFMTLARLDAADDGAELFDAMNRLVVGPRLKAYMGSMKSAQPHYLNVQQIKGGDPEAAGGIRTELVEKVIARARSNGRVTKEFADATARNLNGGDR